MDLLPIRNEIPVGIAPKPRNSTPQAESHAKDPKARDIAKGVVALIVVVAIIWALLYFFK